MENPDIRIADKNRVARFEHSGKKEDGPKVEDIYFDFDNESPFTPWNQRIALLLAKEYVKEVGEYSKDTKEVQKSFMQRLRKLHAKYRESLLDPSPTLLDRKEAKKRAANRKGRRDAVSKHSGLFGEVTDH